MDVEKYCDANNSRVRLRAVHYRHLLYVCDIHCTLGRFVEWNDLKNHSNLWPNKGAIFIMWQIWAHIMPTYHLCAIYCSNGRLWEDLCDESSLGMHNEYVKIRCDSWPLVFGYKTIVEYTIPQQKCIKNMCEESCVGLFSMFI